MLGQSKPRRLDELVTVSLRELVPADTFYCQLGAKLDLSVVRDWTREFYAAPGGRPSIDPVIFFTLQFWDSATGNESNCRISIALAL